MRNTFSNAMIAHRAGGSPGIRSAEVVVRRIAGAFSMKCEIACLAPSNRLLSKSRRPKKSSQAYGPDPNYSRRHHWRGLVARVEAKARSNGSRDPVFGDRQPVEFFRSNMLIPIVRAIGAILSITGVLDTDRVRTIAGEAQDRFGVANADQSTKFAKRGQRASIIALLDTLPCDLRRIDFAQRPRRRDEIYLRHGFT
jgi:hypothetical protein